MKKHIIFITLSFLLLSCGARKVAIDKIDIKKDSITETKAVVVAIDKSSIKDTTNIKTNITIDEVTLTPVDNSKQIFVNNIPYENVVLKIKKTKDNSLYTNNKIVVNDVRSDSTGSIKAKVTEHKVVDNKRVDKKADYSMYIGLLIVIIIVYTLWRNKLMFL
jgi:hypothetical protein